MIFTEQELNIGVNAYNIINESVSIDGGRLISLQTIPLIESSSVGGLIVRFNDIELFSEEYGIDYIDTMLALAEANNIDPQYLAVALDEYKLIQNPELIYELANVITIPQSPNSPAYEFCEACLEGYIYTGDEGFINLLVENDPYDWGEWAENNPPSNVVRNLKTGKLQKAPKLSSILKQTDSQKAINQYREEQFAEQNRRRNAAEEQRRRTEGIVKAGGYGDDSTTDWLANENPKKKDPVEKTASDGAPKAAQEIGKKEDDKKSEGIIDKIKRTVGSAAHKSADWIARKISALRSLYQNWQEKARVAKAQGKASWFQTVGEKVLNAIDWALSKLENLLKASNASRKKYGIDNWNDVEGGDASNIARAHQGYDTWKKNYDHKWSLKK